MNEKISYLIRTAREEAGRTQKDLAIHLGKTPASISDIERGKVQIPAAELFEIANFLEKPIEYFFGIEFDRTIQAKIEAAIQQSTDEELDELMTVLSYASNLTKFRDHINQKYKHSDVLDNEDTLDFYQIIIPYFELLTKKRNEVLEMKEYVEEVLGFIEK